MYCIKCGVELADTEKICPLCQTTVYHPDLKPEAGQTLYPAGQYPHTRSRSFALPVVLSVAFLLPMLIVLLCDLQLGGGITWSGFVIGALLLGYVGLVLPVWFKAPNPVIFFPCTFAAAALYLLYIDLVTAGGWFLSFAFPVVGSLALIITAVVTLLRYVRRGKLYIFGGAVLALGMLTPLIELLLSVTFASIRFVGWSFYPLVTSVLLGGVLIFFAICRPARETMERKFFF